MSNVKIHKIMGFNINELKSSVLFCEIFFMKL